MSMQGAIRDSASDEVQNKRFCGEQQLRRGIRVLPLNPPLRRLARAIVVYTQKLLEETDVSKLKQSNQVMEIVECSAYCAYH
mmetsp:Transcript_18532/g.20142  ORF Transcript_18532/g.20142 Transcript_18532/m.20142 type:complete len:82 (+) Transcript_18532:75-320(+)